MTDVLSPFQPSWDDDTDDFLKSMLNGPDLSAEIENITESVCPSDTSSDSGCPEDRVRALASPGLDDERYSPGSYFDTGSDTSPAPNTNVDLVDFIGNDTDDGDMTGEVVSPVTLIQDPEMQTATGTTTISLPIVQPHAAGVSVPVSVTPLRLAPRDQAPAAKRRRVSASSSDSGLEDNNSTGQIYRHGTGKYLAPLG